MADDPTEPGRDEPALPADLARLLSEQAVWDDSDPADEDAIVAAISVERGDRAPAGAADPRPAPARSVVRVLAPFLAGVAAALLVSVGIAAFAGSDDEPDGEVVALAGTDLAPDASAEASVLDTPLGTRMVLDVSNLAPAPPGSYYEAWLRESAEVGVSAGTFHLRGGDGDIELWAGVSLAEYPLITVTLQEEGEVGSSGQVVLRGTGAGG